MKEHRYSKGLLRTTALCLLSGVIVLMTADCVSYPMMGPPGLRVETYFNSPGPGYFWMSGYWGWGSGRYYWIPGRWMRERRGYSWDQGQWEHRGQRWNWRGGRWRRNR
jgi:hypothetical protein